MDESEMQIGFLFPIKPITIQIKPTGFRLFKLQVPFCENLLRLSQHICPAG